VEVAAKAEKFGKQIKYADRRGIPFVWFSTDEDGNLNHEVKDIRSGEQVAADPKTWTPPAADLIPQITSAQ
jgi:histidyl-tRNA synthetase